MKRIIPITAFLLACSGLAYAAMTAKSALAGGPRTPQALLALPTQPAPLVSGTVQIDTASEGFITGSLTSQVMLGGVATDVNGTFSSPTCP